MGPVELLLLRHGESVGNVARGGRYVCVSVANTSVTRLVRADGAAAWTLDFFNAQQHLIEHGSQPTEHPAEHDVEPH